MDIVSFGKANKSFRKSRELSEEIVGLEVEKHYKSLDERLDEILIQASSSVAQKSIDVNLSKGIFSDTAFKNQRIELLEVSPGVYKESGIWESEVIDLGENWKETLSINR